MFDDLSPKIAIDLGTSNIRILSAHLDEVKTEPAVSAINTNSKKVIAVGFEAKEMIGKTPSYIKTSIPLVGGVISDFDATEALLNWFISDISKGFKGIKKFLKPVVIIAVPTIVTEVEISAVIDALKYAGARKVYIVEEPLAASVGANLPYSDPQASLIVDIGGGTTDIAVISLNGILFDNSKKIGGNDFDNAIISYVRDKYNLQISKKTAEDVKIKLANLIPSVKTNKAEIKGQDIFSSLPKSIEISEVEVNDAIRPVVLMIISKIKEILEKISNDAVADIIKNKITLCGGGSKIKNLDKLMSKELKLEVQIPDDAEFAVILGLNKIIEDKELLKNLQIKDLIFK